MCGLKELTKIALLLPLTMLAASCSTLGPSAKTIRLNNCAGWEPIAVTSNDVKVLSDRAVLDIARHNKHGKDIGCWSPVKQNGTH